MWDKKRKIIDSTAQIDNLIIHHSAGGELYNESDEDIINLMSDIGYARGYAQYGYNKKTGYSDKYGQNYRKKFGRGGVSFAEYHYLVRRYDKDGNKYGYKIIQLVDDPVYQDVGSVSEYKINTVSIAICFAGNYEENDAPKNMLDYFISCFEKQGSLEWLLLKNPEIHIIGHKDTGDKTKCPGKNLYAKLNYLRGGILK